MSPASPASPPPSPPLHASPLRSPVGRWLLVGIVSNAAVMYTASRRRGQKVRLLQPFVYTALSEGSFSSSIVIRTARHAPVTGRIRLACRFQGVRDAGASVRPVHSFGGRCPMPVTAFLGRRRYCHASRTETSKWLA